MNSSLTSDPWIGRSVGDRQRYRLDKRLGAGGMGDVFLAMDVLLGQQVALKLLKDTLVASEELKKRFEREVALCAALHSEHIVQVSDYGVTSEGHPFYVMEYLRGQSLGQLLRQQRQLSVERTVSVIAQVCTGLYLAHQGTTLWRDGATASEHVKVIHRDLKPDNIFLVPTALGELVKILDFGIAKIRSLDAIEHTDLTNMFIGTFHYAAPEQLVTETHLDERADIYSLGIILYEMLSGTDPFGLGLSINNISGMSWALAHSSKPPIPLRSQPGCEQLSPELETVIMRCLQKAPLERFASVDELSQALQAAVAQSHELIPPLTPTLQVSSHHSVCDDSVLLDVAPTSKSKLPLLSIGAGVVIAAAITGTAYTYLRSQSAQTKILAEIGLLRSKAKYTDCITKVKTVSKDSSIYNKAQQFLNQCQLEQANKLLAVNKFVEAITVASSIPKDSILYVKARSLSEQASNSIINLATAQFQAGKLDSAIAQAQAIPATSSIYPKARSAIAQWQKDWRVAETQFSAAKTALSEGKWQVVVDESNKVPNISYWQVKTKPVVQEAQSQIAKAAVIAAQTKYQPPSTTEPITQTQTPQARPRTYTPPVARVRNNTPSVPANRRWEESASAPPANGGWEGEDSASDETSSPNSF